MSCFDEDCYDELPSAGSLFFTGGVYLPLTIVDLEIVIGLTIDRLIVNISTALQDALVIHRRTSYFPPGIRSPDLNESTMADPLDQLKKRRDLHSFLGDHAGGLKQFDLMIAATRKVLSLHIKSYASLLLRVRPKLGLENFNLEQRAHYCSSVVIAWVQAPNLRDFIKGKIPADIPFADYIERSVGLELLDQLREGDHTQTILKVAAEFVNKWRGQFSRNASNATASEADQQNCDFFMKVIGKL
jgi:hypothetical protein